MTDLTWQQMQTAATSMGINNLFTIVNGEVVIRVSALFNAPAISLTATGVVETLFDLREIASKAQESINVNKPVGERLAAFPASTGGTPINNSVQQVGLIYVRRPLASTGIVGVTN